MKKKSQPRYSISLVFFYKTPVGGIYIYILEERELKSRKLLKNLECPKQEKFHFSMCLDQSPIRKKTRHQTLRFILEDHSSIIRGLCLMKLSREMPQNLPYFWSMKTQIIGFFFHFSIQATLDY